MSYRTLIAEVCHPILKEKLELAGFHCDWLPKISNEELNKIIHQYDVLVVRSKICVDANLIDQASKLKVVARVGSGMELIDVAYAESKGMVCLNSPEGNCHSVAEHAVGSMIALLKSFRKKDIALRNGLWLRKDQEGRELGSQTVGLLGFGNTGSALAQKLLGFGCKILAYDKYKTNFGNKLVVEATMTDLFEQTDILSIHLPLTTETHFLVNESFINQFKKNIFLINTSRGPIVKTTDLLLALETEKIKGAALDVFEREPLKGLTEENEHWWKKLQQNEQVLLSPHIAGVTADSFHKLASILAEKIIKCLINVSEQS